MLNDQRVILVSNFVLEIPSAVFDQLSSVQKPYYALASMILSLAVTSMGVFDLARTGREERVKWVCKRGQIPWFYSSNSSGLKPLGTKVDIIGLVCGISQFISATITFMFLSHQTNDPIKISLWPLIFSFGVLCSKFPRNAHTIQDIELEEVLTDPPTPENNPTQKPLIHDPLSSESFSHSPLETHTSLMSSPAEETGVWGEDSTENDEPFFGNLQLLNPQSEGSRLPLNIQIPGKISSLESFQIQNICSLHLQGCREFSRLPKSLYTLENLRYMNLEDCPDMLGPTKDCLTHDSLDLLHIENCPNMFYPKQITLHQSETGGLKTIYSNGVNCIVICKLHLFLSIFHRFRQQQKQACKLEGIKFKNDFPKLGAPKLKMA